MFYRILIRRSPALRHHCRKRDEEDDGSCHCYPRPPRDAIGVLDNPLLHEIDHDRHGDDKGYNDIHKERAHKPAAHLSTGGAKHLAHSYLLLPLLDEVGGHGYQAEDGDKYRHKGKE